MWPSGWLTVPAKGVKGAGTIPAYRRLLRLRWESDAPALALTRRRLFRLLAEDDDTTFLEEFSARTTNEDTLHRHRRVLREAAAAALAEAGYESDPRLRGAVNRMALRTLRWLKTSPTISDTPLAPDATPPSFHLLAAFAAMPKFRSEHHEFMDRVVAFLASPWPKRAVRQVVGPQTLDEPDLVVGDPLSTHGPATNDLARTVAWLEIVAHAGLLRRLESAMVAFDTLVAQCDARGVWTGATLADSTDAWAWPALRLDDARDASKATAIDLSLRLAGIAKADGRELRFG
jgi:hypothetical protein